MLPFISFLVKFLSSKLITIFMAKTKSKISASILSADFHRLNLQIYDLEPYVDEWHIDVMDGHFVPNISFGSDFVKAVRKLTKVPLDVHLMIADPMKHIDNFVDAGADMITFHYETANYFECREYIRKKNVKVGIAYNPITPAYIFDGDLDRVLIMSVNPGFAGQQFIDNSLKKIYQAKKWVKKKNYSIEIAVDGGINDETAYQSFRNGADVVIAGSYIFKGYNPKVNIQALRHSLLAGSINRKKI